MISYNRLIVTKEVTMTALNMASHIRHLYTQGLRDYEICARIKTSPIFTKHTIAKIIASDPAAESKHYQNRRRKGRMVNARFANDDPYWEEVDRFD
jgi:hypothetical protein